MGKMSNRVFRKTRSPRFLPALTVIALLSLLVGTQGGCDVNQPEGWGCGSGSKTTGGQAGGAQDQATSAKYQDAKPFVLVCDMTKDQGILGDDFGCAPSQFDKALQGLVIHIGLPDTPGEDTYFFGAKTELDFDEDATQFEGELWHFVDHTKMTIIGRYDWAKGAIVEGQIEIFADGYKTNQYPMSDLSPVDDYNIEFDYRYVGSTLCSDQFAQNYVTPAPGTSVRLISTRGEKTLTEHWTWGGGDRTNDENKESLGSFAPYFVVAADTE